MTAPAVSSSSAATAPIYQRSDGRWEAKIDLGLDPVTGKRRRKSYLGRTREEVRRKLVTGQRERDQGLPIVREDRTLGQFIAEWLEMNQPPQLEAKTWHGYEQLLRVHVLPALGSVRLARLTPQQVQALYAGKLREGLSSTTVNHLHRALHRVLETAVRLEVVQRNVSAQVDAPRVRTREMRPLSAEEARRFLEVCAGDP